MFYTVLLWKDCLVCYILYSLIAQKVFFTFLCIFTPYWMAPWISQWIFFYKYVYIFYASEKNIVFLIIFVIKIIFYISFMYLIILSVLVCVEG